MNYIYAYKFSNKCYVQTVLHIHLYSLAKKVQRGEGCIRKYRIYSGLINKIGLILTDKTDPLREVFWENNLRLRQYKCRGMTVASLKKFERIK